MFIVCIVEDYMQTLAYSTQFNCKDSAISELESRWSFLIPLGLTQQCAEQRLASFTQAVSNQHCSNQVIVFAWQMKNSS